MQHIQDNEFDRLFKDQLGDCEVQPSADLWDRIEPQIAKKKKRSLPVYWAAAAIALLALSAGLLLMETEKQPSGAQQATVIAASKAEGADQKDAGKSVIPEKAVVNKGSDRVNTTTITTKLPRMALTEKNLANENKKSLIVMQPLDGKNHHRYTTPLQEIEKPVEEVRELPVPDVSLADNNMSAAANAPLAVVDAITETNETAEIEQTTRPRIRNAGDLVNFVVEKIDKREQKLVEFRTDDDENSSLVAINIGPFRINQRKSK